MEARPLKWNVVIVGNWNRAILTPLGVVRILFDRQEDKPIPVEIPLDGLSPFRVRIDELLVVAGDEQLIVEAERATLNLLNRACSVSRNALDRLPRTPVSAVGINFRFEIEGGFGDIFHARELDGQLKASGFTPVAQTLKRAVHLDKGILNLIVEEEAEKSPTLLFNFELKTDQIDELKAWLDSPLEDRYEIVGQLMNHVLPGANVLEGSKI